MTPTKRPDPGRVPGVEQPQDTMAELFGLTPGADAYSRQLSQFKAQAARADRMAKEAREHAESAKLLCQRAKNLAKDMTERQLKYVDTAEKIRKTGIFIAACTVLCFITSLMRLFI